MRSAWVTVGRDCLLCVTDITYYYYLTIRRGIYFFPTSVRGGQEVKTATRSTWVTVGRGSLSWVTKITYYYLTSHGGIYYSSIRCEGV